VTVSLEPEINETDPVEPPKKSRKKIILIVAILLVAFAGVAVAGALVWYMNTGKPLTMLPGVITNTTPHYIETIYKVDLPLGVAVDDANGRLYVTQSAGDRNVAVFNLKGDKIGVLTPPGAKNSIHTPVYAAVDPANGDVYVSDRAVASVFVYDKSGKYVKTFKPQTTKPWAPMGLYFDSEGLLYITNTPEGSPHNVMVVKTDGTVMRTLGEADKLSFPNAAVSDGKGGVIVSDSNNGRILFYGQSGEKNVGALARGNATASLGLPRGIVFSDGKLYVVDVANHMIKMYTVPSDGTDTTPKYTESFGQEGTINGTFEYPNGLAMDSRGRLYVADRENNRVQVWSY
jgi:DNA-binding beta-propeller fold protein YncE